ncbi:MAG: hypothetical protein PHP35_01720 [Candidatus Colwellbacteria bacterium]|nr:hypothetical protein [Candidatus Colwellbacteria bacterium]
MDIKIPRDLPQFDEKRALIIVSGGLEARVFLGDKGSLLEISHLRAPEIHYTDKENRFAKRVKGQTLGMGSVMKPVHRKEEAEFLKTFKKEILKTIKKNNPDNIFVFVPRYPAAAIIGSLPKPFDKKAKVISYGNYLDKHPKEILSLIKGQRP